MKRIIIIDRKIISYLKNKITKDQNKLNLIKTNEAFPDTITTSNTTTTNNEQLNNNNINRCKKIIITINPHRIN